MIPQVVRTHERLSFSRMGMLPGQLSCQMTFYCRITYDHFFLYIRTTSDLITIGTGTTRLSSPTHPTPDYPGSWAVRVGLQKCVGGGHLKPKWPPMHNHFLILTYVVAAFLKDTITS